MIAPRLAAVAVVSAAACQAVVGADGDFREAVVEMCRCDELRFLGTPTECEARLERRLGGATDATRAEWLQKYVDECTSCPNVAQCYYTSPTCSLASCTTHEECCGFHDGATCDEASGECSAP